jgi:transposase
MESIPKACVGVDVSKNNLDIYIYPEGKSFKVANTKAGIKGLIKNLGKYNVAQIASEATDYLQKFY